MSEKKRKSTLNTMIKSTLKNAFLKANPFDKKINKNDVSDTGTETVRLAYRSIKTVKKSVKTTQRTIKTVGSTVRNTGTVIYKTTAFTVKSVVAVSKFAGNVVANTVAFLMNPIVIIIIFVVACILLLGSVLIIVAGDDTDKSTRVNASGLIDIPSQYQTGLEYLHIAVENKQNDFNSLIDSFYFNYDDLTNSDLVYMERTLPSPVKKYETSFATDDRKNSLKSEWNITLTEREIIAIAYVYLEKTENTSNGTTGGIYEVNFTQEVFDTIISKCVSYSDTVYAGQVCPNQDCMGQIEIIDNPDYAPILAAHDNSVNAYNDWAEVADALYINSHIPNGTAQAAHWDNTVTPLINNWINIYNRYPDTANNGEDFLAVLGSEYEYYLELLNNTPPTIERRTIVCGYVHNLHSIGLSFFSKDDIMNALDFTDNDKQWVELTETGFENNPDIP